MEAEEKPDDNPPIQKFLVVGIITSEDFQKCRFAVLKLRQSFPKEFETPDIRPMLDVEWNEFITKYQRRLGNGLWSIQNRVAVFKDGEFLGDFSDLNAFIWKKWKYVFHQNWHEMACRHLIEYFQEKTSHYRQLIYLTIAINGHAIGSLLFELYNDVVPLTCENFINRCRNGNGGYAGAPIHRIVNNSWIQCGGHDLDPRLMPCENYVVPHDRRGVLSMCNSGRHKDNSTQFFVSLDSCTWMNYKYVAFGQLLQGDNILKMIENVPTYYEAPTSNITIVKCGEFKIRLQLDKSDVLFTTEEIEQWEETQRQMDVIKYLQSYDRVVMDGEGGFALNHFATPLHKKSLDSFISASQIKYGNYSLKSDRRSYYPFSHLPDGDDSEGIEDYGICEPGYSLKTYKPPLDYESISPGSSDITL